MSGKLRFGDGLSLPFDAVTETFGFVGNRGSGKTYGAKRLGEEMLRAHAQVVVLDPVDAWWGLRYGRDKGASGLPVYVFGGIRADSGLVLEPTAGSLLADVVVERGISAVLSLRGMNRTNQRAFARDFLERLYFRKGEEQYRTPVHVFIEEAHTFAPQNPVSGDRVAGSCLAAVQDVFLQGRGSGIGGTLVTQRVAAVSKSVLELVEVMAAFRTTGPNARKALGGKDGWFSAHDDDPERLREFLAAVPTLPRGEAYVWSPGLLDVFGRYEILEAETFDSSATPKAGQKTPTPKGEAAPLDLDVLGEEIAATRERAEANDPGKLHAEINRLRELVEVYEQTAQVDSQIAAEVVDRPVPFVPEEAKAAVEQLRGEIDAAFGGLYDVVGKRRNELVRLSNETQALLLSVPAPVPEIPTVVPDASVGADGGYCAPVENPAPARVPGLTKAESTLLSALVQFHPKPVTKRRLLVAAGYSGKSSTPVEALGKLRGKGFVEGPATDLSVTPAGIAALGGSVPALPRPGPDLVSYWKVRLSSSEAKLLGAIVAVYPRETTFEDACAWVGYSTNSSTPVEAVSSLRSLGLIEGDRNALHASSELMGS